MCFQIIFFFRDLFKQAPVIFAPKYISILNGKLNRWLKRGKIIDKLSHIRVFGSIVISIKLIIIIIKYVDDIVKYF